MDASLPHSRSCRRRPHDNRPTWRRADQRTYPQAALKLPVLKCRRPHKNRRLQSVCLCATWTCGSTRGRGKFLHAMSDGIVTNGSVEMSTTPGQHSEDSRERTPHVRSLFQRLCESDFKKGEINV